MRKIGWAICALALALAAPPALAEEAGEATAEAQAAAPEAGEAAPESLAEPLAGRVLRASFTTAVVDREPQDSVTSLANDTSQILFHTEFSGLEGHTLTHVWERDGVEMARVPFVVDGPRWRVHSAKNLDPSWLGEWTVRVVDEEGRELVSESFAYVAADSPAAAASAPAGEPAAPAEEPAEAPEAEPAVPAAIE